MRAMCSKVVSRQVRHYFKLKQKTHDRSNNQSYMSPVTNVIKKEVFLQSCDCTRLVEIIKNKNLFFLFRIYTSIEVLVSKSIHSS